jgi:hypothetical protein
MFYAYARNSVGFRLDEKESHYVDCFLVTCVAMLLGV